MNAEVSFADDLAGPLAIAVWFNCFFLGVEATQVFSYFRAYKQDSHLLKASVLAAIVNDFFGSIVICHDVYRWSIQDFGNPLGIAKPGWPSAATALSTGISVIICQSYLIARFHRVSDLRVAAIFMAACALAGFGYSLHAVAVVAQLKTLADASRFSPIVQAFLSLEAATDVIISLGLVAFLWRHYKSTEFHSTKSLLRRLMLVSLESGLVTTCYALLAVILLSVKRNTNLGIAVAYTIGRIYSLTLLFNLNMRRPSGSVNREPDIEETCKLDSCVRLKLPQVQINGVPETIDSASSEKDLDKESIALSV